MQAQDRQAAPEAATGWMGRTLATAKSQMMSAANPYAVEAGLEILRAGGSAADAAVAVQLVLNLVEPQSSGIGGGAFILHWNAARKELKTYDGRETAPQAAKPDRFLVEGEPRGLEDAIYGGLSIGVPGTVRALEALHKQQGKLPWARLFAPAIKLASDGFRVPSRLHLLLRWYGADSFSPRARRYFFDQTGSARPSGYLLKNPEFAATLRAIAEQRRRCVLCRAGWPRRSCRLCAPRPTTPATSRWPISPATASRSASRCAPPIAAIASAAWARPRPGGIAVAQTLKLLEPFDLGTSPSDAMNGKALHLIAEAQKLAFADRDYYIGDPDFVPAPSGLLESRYLDTRRALIDQGAAMLRPSPGKLPEIGSRTLGDDETVEQPGTSHFSIVDAGGNVLSMTTTIESAFGSRVVGGGLPAQQRADRLRLPPGRSQRPAARQRGRTRQAPAQLDGTRPSCSTSRASRGPHSARPAAAASSSTSSRRWWR